MGIFDDAIDSEQARRDQLRQDELGRDRQAQVNLATVRQLAREFVDTMNRHHAPSRQITDRSVRQRPAWLPGKGTKEVQRVVADGWVVRAFDSGGKDRNSSPGYAVTHEGEVLVLGLGPGGWREVTSADVRPLRPGDDKPARDIQDMLIRYVQTTIPT